jgi:hypothetical protein
MKKFVPECRAFVTATKMASFFAELGKLYHAENPYHNDLHACDVLCSINYFIQQSTMSDLITSLEYVAITISAAAHDVGHLGLNNRYLIRDQ